MHGFCRYTDFDYFQKFDLHWFYSINCMQKFRRYTVFWCPNIITHNTLLFSKYTDFSCPQNQRCARPYCMLISQSSNRWRCSMSFRYHMKQSAPYWPMPELFRQILLSLNLKLHFPVTKYHFRGSESESAWGFEGSRGAWSAWNSNCIATITF